MFLHTLEVIFLLCFLVFDGTNGEEAGLVPERRFAFSALGAVLVLTTQVLHDLDNPMNGGCCCSHMLWPVGI